MDKLSFSYGSVIKSKRILNFGGAQDVETSISDHGSRNGKPLRRFEAD